MKYLQSLATRYSLNPKTVAAQTHHRSGCHAGTSTGIDGTYRRARSPGVAFRRHTLLPLDDCLHALQATIPQFSRSALHRCFQRHGISRLPLSADGQNPLKKKCKDYPMSYLPVDFAEVQTEEGRQYLFVVIDRTRKVGFAERHPPAPRLSAAAFVCRVLEKRPYQGQAVLTDTGVLFILPPRQVFAGSHRLERVCRAFGGAHRLSKPAQPWPHEQGERVHRPRREAPGPRYHYQTRAQRPEPLHALLLAAPHAKRLTWLRGLPPHEFVWARWQKNPTSFTRDRPSLPWHYTSKSIHAPKPPEVGHCGVGNCGATTKATAWLAGAAKVMGLTAPISWVCYRYQNRPRHTERARADTSWCGRSCAARICVRAASGHLMSSRHAPGSRRRTAAGEPSSPATEQTTSSRSWKEEK